MMKNFDNSLTSLAGMTVCISPGNDYPEPGQASIFVRFERGELLSAAYWRVVENGQAGVSSFDHQQKYGLPAPIDAISALQQKLNERHVVEAQIVNETGDLLFRFTGNISLQVFNFTGYEIWEMRFPYGAVEYSNRNK
jgi:hypothetical protein